MTRVRVNEEILKMRFEEAYGRPASGEIATTAEAASLLNFSSRTFLNCVDT